MADVVSQAIYKMGVEGQQTVDAAGASVDRLAVSEEKLTRATRTSADSVDRLLGRLDPRIRAEQQLQAALAQVNRFEEEGIGTAAQRAQAIDAATARYSQAIQRLNGTGAQATFIGAGNAAKLSAFQLQNLSFQMQDVGQALATGQPLFRTFIQQGSQIAQIFGPGVGVGGALKAVGSGILTYLTNPLNVAVLAFSLATLAASALFNAIRGNSGESAADALKRHKEIIDQITKAYSEANAEARKLGQIETLEPKAQGLAQLVELTNKIIEEKKRFTDDFGKLFQFGDSQALLGGIGMTNPFANLHVPQGFLDEVEKYKTAVHDGNANTGDLRDTLSKLALAFPTSENLTFVDSVLKATQATFDLEEQQRLLAASLRAASGQATSQDAVLLGLVGKLHSASIATDELRQRLAGTMITMAPPDPRDTSLTGFSARFDPLTAARHEAEEAAKKAAGVGDSLQKQFDNALKATQKQTDALVAQASALGNGVGATAEYTKQQELLNLAEANHLKLSAGDIAGINALAAAYGAATQKLAEMNKLRDLQFEGSQLGRTANEQAIASTLRGIYGDNWQREINGAIASQMRLNDAFKTAQGLAQDFASSFVSDLRNGVSAVDALKNALSRLGDKLIDMALNQAINALFGNLFGALGGGGGGLNLFGGNGASLGGGHGGLSLLAANSNTPTRVAANSAGPTFNISVPVTPAAGQSNAEAAAAAGAVVEQAVLKHLDHYNRKVLPLRMKEINRDPRKIG